MMNSKKKLALALLVASAAWPGLLRAQTATPAAPASTVPAEDEIIQLSPFEVNAKKDNGYAATETLAGTRIRTDLKDVGSAISVVTKQFLQDVGATDSGTLLQYTTNAEVAGTRGTYTGLGNATSLDESATLRAPAGAQRVRGLASADNTRDFFVTDIPWDSYNVDRIDIQRGPNSILFGLGSPAGIVNASTRNAEFRNKGEVGFRVGSYGSTRTNVDVNQELIENVLAIRLDGLWNNESYKQKPAFQDDKRAYAALRFDPQLFKDRSWHTSLKARFENGDIKANRPRITPPNDSLTPWFRPINLDPNNLDGGMGKLSITNAYAIGAATSTVSPWLNGGGIDQQQPAWFIDGQTAALDRIYGGYVNTGARTPTGSLLSASESLSGQRYSQPFFGLGSLNQYAGIARLTGSSYGQYRTASLQDPTVFDFYHNLIDGPTKSEFERWNAYNIDLSQTAFDDRLGVQLTYDRQKYKRGGESLLGGQGGNPALTIDILKTFQDFTNNPNYGRPYVLGGPGYGTSYESDRKYVRGSLFGELRSRDLFQNDFLVKLLGKHRFNGVYSDEKYFSETRQWQQYANNRAWDSYWTRVDGNLNGINNRAPVAVIYLGSSIAGQTAASGANIPGIAAPVTLADGNLYYFDATWKNPTGVNFTDPWTVPANLDPAFNSGALPTAQNGQFYQNSNPANYVGWNTNYQMNLLRYDGGKDLSLLRSSGKTMRQTKSYAGSWQGFLWNDAFVPTLGWRYDEVKGQAVVAQSVASNRAILNLNQTGDASTRPYALPESSTGLNSNQSYSLFKDHSTAGGLVVHLNKLLEKDPLPINVSLSYNKSSNFQVTNTRRDIYGNVIGNPSGSTKDYGVLLSTKDGKYSFRAIKYETSLTNADTQLDASGLTGTIKNGMNWRNIMLYKLSGYVWATRDSVNVRHDWIPAYVNSSGRAVWSTDKVNAGQPAPAGSTLQTQAQSDAMRDATITAWNDIQKYLQGKGYFSAWNYGAGPTTLAALTDRAGYEANPSSHQPDPASVYDYRNNPNLQGFAVTADTQSKGYEFEFTANPLPNWRITFNAAQTTAIRTNVGGPLLDGVVDYMTTKIGTATVPGAAGDMRMFNAHFDDPTNVIWNNGGWVNFRSGYTLMKLQEGAAASELRKWRYNLVTNYSFTHGFVKGVGVGAGYRWQDKVVIGYPVLAGAGGLATFDLSKPYYGPSEDGIDLWVSYERKLTKKIGWKIQANVRNLGKQDGLVPISIQPDGRTWAGVRMQPTEEWFVTNTFSF